AVGSNKAGTFDNDALEFPVALFQNYRAGSGTHLRHGSLILTEVMDRAADVLQKLGGGDLPSGIAAPHRSSQALPKTRADLGTQRHIHLSNIGIAFVVAPGPARQLKRPPQVGNRLERVDLFADVPA